MATRPTLAMALRDCARAVARVVAGRSLAAQLESYAGDSAATSRATLIDLCHGTLRRYGRVQAIVARLSRRGLADPGAQALLWCALYALDSGRYAAYTVVDQAVRACELLGNSAAKGYVNGVLRAFLRTRELVERSILSNPEARYQHPGWWIDALRRAYPDDWERVIEAGNSHPPMCLRVNRRRVTVEGYLRELEGAGMKARRIGESAVLLEHPVPVHRLPGFAEGQVSVQDAGAQRAAELLDLANGQRVLDACAAPGGKSAHVLEIADVELTALDTDAARSARIGQNLERLGLAGATVKVADCAVHPSWWDGRPFERVLAYVPCSASGVARRHPDIKWLRRPGDVPAFSARQSSILEALWRVLATDGKLLYVTCSIFPEENSAVVDAFLERTPAAQRLSLAGDSPPLLLPCPAHDGFYFALLKKRA